MFQSAMHYTPSVKGSIRRNSYDSRDYTTLPNTIWSVSDLEQMKKDRELSLYLTWVKWNELERI